MKRRPPDSTTIKSKHEEFLLELSFGLIVLFKNMEIVKSGDKMRCGIEVFNRFNNSCKNSSHSKESLIVLHRVCSHHSHRSDPEVSFYFQKKSYDFPYSFLCDRSAVF